MMLIKKKKISVCHQALKHIKKLKTVNNVPQSQKLQKMTSRMDGIIHRLSEAKRHSSLRLINI